MTHFRSPHLTLKYTALAKGMLLLALTACAEESIVGEAATFASSSEEAGADESQSALPAASFEQYGECAPEYEDLVQPYLEWKNAENHWEPLHGKAFEGYVEGGPNLRLTINENGSGSLVVGTAVDVGQRDEGYLCSGCQTLLIEGGTYPIHGAELEGGHLIVPLDPNSPYDPWCALQTPVIWDAEQRECTYAVARGDTIEGGGEVCKLGSEVVDCGWLTLADPFGFCSCTPDGCFSKSRLPTGLSMDGRVSEDVIAGSVVYGSNFSFYLFPVDS